MEIRFAAPGDIPGMIDLLKQVGQVHHLGRPDIFRAGAQKYNRQQLMTMLDKPTDPIFVAVEDGKVLGYCFCQFKTTKDDPVIMDFTTCYIDDLCVDETCRGKRVGKTLYEHTCRYAKEQGCYSVTLNVWSCNESAMGFYEKMGLKPQKVGMETIL